MNVSCVRACRFAEPFEEPAAKARMLGNSRPEDEVRPRYLCLSRLAWSVSEGYDLYRRVTHFFEKTI